VVTRSTAGRYRILKGLDFTQTAYGTKEALLFFVLLGQASKKKRKKKTHTQIVKYL
jgi:hypothetical protein